MYMHLVNTKHKTNLLSDNMKTYVFTAMSEPSKHFELEQTELMTCLCFHYTASITRLVCAKAIKKKRKPKLQFATIKTYLQIVEILDRCVQ